MFTEEEVTTAKKVRDTIISENVDELKSIYMAGEIVMWDEQQAKNLQQAHVIKSLLADLPENRPLYKDSGLWQMRSDDMEEVLIQQGVNETDIEFLARCKASNVL